MPGVCRARVAVLGLATHFPPELADRRRSRRPSPTGPPEHALTEADTSLDAPRHRCRNEVDWHDRTAGRREGLPILNEGEPGLLSQVAGVSLVRARIRTPDQLDRAASLSDILGSCPGHALRFEGASDTFFIKYLY